ncbi:MAG: DUF2341 domain-containing protein, partial [Candidatus Thermoplasmatota archaeon]|nr:DUF2341 domain-containing protein [Candidatus Thermoplasmatota archaeon]
MRTGRLLHPALALVVGALLTVSTVPTAAAALPGFGTVQVFEVTNPNAEPLTGFQVPIELDTASAITAGEMESDCSDIRFTDADGSTVIPHWLEDGCNTGATQFWVKVPTIPASGTTTVYAFWDNPGVGDASSKLDVLDSFTDDFSTDPNTNGQWTTVKHSGSGGEFIYQALEEYVRLTESQGSKGVLGEMSADGYPVEVSFDFRINGGADGMAFTWLRDLSGITSVGDGGSFALEASIPRDGMALELDTFDNGAEDPGTPHAAIVRTDSNVAFRPHTASQTTSALNDGSWHTIDLTIQGDQSAISSVLLDGSSLSPLADAPVTGSSGCDLAFAAATGGVFATHDLDNVDILYRQCADEDVTVSSTQGPVPTPELATLAM